MCAEIKRMKYNFEKQATIFVSKRIKIEVKQYQTFFVQNKLPIFCEMPMLHISTSKSKIGKYIKCLKKKHLSSYKQEANIDRHIVLNV